MEAGSGVDVVATQPYRWPVPRSSVDVVISGQAFEHIEFPWVSMLEVQRVLRPGGLLLLIVPASGPEHRFPFDCWRFYPDGLRAMACWADLHVVEAVTHWDAAGYPEDSAQWRDSVLVARKPTGKGWRLLIGEGKRRAFRGVTTAPSPTSERFRALSSCADTLVSQRSSIVLRGPVVIGGDGTPRHDEETDLGGGGHGLRAGAEAGFCAGDGRARSPLRSRPDRVRRTNQQLQRFWSPIAIRRAAGEPGRRAE